MQGYATRAVLFISIKHIILFLFHLRQHTQASAQPPTAFGLGHHGDPIQVQLKNKLDRIGLSYLFCAAWWLCSDDSLLWGQRLVCSGCAKCSVISTLDRRRACSSLVDEIFMGFRNTSALASEIMVKILRGGAAQPWKSWLLLHKGSLWCLACLRHRLTSQTLDVMFHVKLELFSLRTEFWILIFLHLSLQWMSEYPLPSTPRWVRLWGMSSQDICSAPWHVVVERANTKTPLAGATKNKPSKDCTPPGKLSSCSLLKLCALFEVKMSNI